MDQSIFKAYDVRGAYPEQVNREVFYAIAQGFAQLLKPKTVVIGHDVRLHSEELKHAMIDGLLDAGVEVTDVGLVSTEMIYFASGNYGFDGGIAVTASHDIADIHGAKFIRKDAEPIFAESGLHEIKEFALRKIKISEPKRAVKKKDITEDYCKFLLSLFDIKRIKPFKILADPNFGYQGKVLDKLIEIGKLPLEVVKLNYEPDGNFPKGRPDPQTSENTKEFTEKILESKVEFGVTWDADGDRVFFGTGKEEFLSSYYTGTLFIKDILNKHPKSKVVYDPRNIFAIKDATEENGGISVPSRVGHSFIKAVMRQSDSVFASEFSGHTYYKDFWYADSGMIPLLQMLDILSRSGKSLTELLSSVQSNYYISGEINYKTNKAEIITNNLEQKYQDGQINRLDGLSVQFPKWRFNLRKSNTGESFLRLNVESIDRPLLDEKLEEITKFIEENK